MVKLLIAGIVGAVMAIGGFFAGQTSNQPKTPQPQSPNFGAFSPTGGGTYRLGQSIGTTDSSVKLSSFKEPVSNIPYTMSYLNSDIGYGTISPQSSVSEFISFSGITQNSDGSATLTGLIRGLTRTPAGSTCTASTTLAQPHAGQSIFILSDSPCFFAEYLPLRTNSTSTAIVAFSSTTPPRLDQPRNQASGTYNATTSEFATIAYVNAISVSGVSNATQGVKGIVQIGTGAQMASSTSSGSTGASLVGDGTTSTSSPYTTGSYAVWTQPNAKIKQIFLDLTEPFTFSGATTTFNATTSIAATSASPLRLNGVNTIWPSTAGASTSVPTWNGSGTITNQLPTSQTIASRYVNAGTSSTGTTTLATQSFAGSVITGAGQVLRVTSTWLGTDNSSTCFYQHDIGNATATTSLGYLRASALNVASQLETTIFATSTTGQVSTTRGFGNLVGDVGNGATTNSTYPYLSTRMSSTTMSSTWNIDFRAKSVSGGDTCTLIGYTVERLAQ